MRIIEDGEKLKDYENHLALVRKHQQELIQLAKSPSTFWLQVHDRKHQLDKEVSMLKKLNGRLPKESRRNVMEDLGFDH